MKKTKIISLFLCLIMVLSTLVPTAFAAEGDGEGGTNQNQGAVVPEGSSTVEWNDNGIYFKKEVTKEDDKHFRITMEAYTTGETVTTVVTEEIPTDIILVLDQSGSMDGYMNTVGFMTYNNRNNNYLYGRRHNSGSKNLYHKLPDGGYATVFVELEQGRTYTQINGNPRNSKYYGGNEALYALVNGTYQEVTVTQYTTGYDFLRPTYRYTYTLPNGTVIHTSDNDAANDRPTFSGITGSVLYRLQADQNQNVYTYYYNLNGTQHIIGTSTGENTVPTFTLYEYNTGTVTRRSALKTAVTNFASNVETKAKGNDGILGNEDDINHRIAVVGFASNNNDYNSQEYENTEVFIGATQYRYNNGAPEQYRNALQSMDTTAGVNNISASINALDANGGTFTNLGLEMANGIINANPVEEGERRNRVVVVFTDGTPGASGYDANVANSAITQGNTLKTAGVTIYTIGIFEGADGSSAGNQNGNAAAKSNWFMQNLSSNDGTPQSPGYYLSAGNHSALNNIFKQISQNINNEYITTTLTSSSVIKDIIAPSFSLPAGTTPSQITLESYRCTGVGTDGKYTWAKNPTALGATASIKSTGNDPGDSTTQNNQLEITGFNYTDNWVGPVVTNQGTTYRGNKLVVSFVVEVRDGFLGGNNVPTNAGVGIYPTPTGDSVIDVDDPIIDVGPAVPEPINIETNVYLGAYYSQTISGQEIAAGLQITVGREGGNKFTLDFSEAGNVERPYGLEPWQIEYLEITLEATAETLSGKPADFKNIREDINYTLIVKIRPRYNGTYNYAEGTGTGIIHVFKPEITCHDSIVFYGDNAPASYNDNISLKWRCTEDSETVYSDNVTMFGTAPTLSYGFTPEDGKIVNGKINTKEYIRVDVNVLMGSGNEPIDNHVYYVHIPCNSIGEETQIPDHWGILETEIPTNEIDHPEFYLHVNTCTLNITKAGGAEGEPYVFKVNKDGVFYTEATVVGNKTVAIKELPVGTYTIEEDTGWSWRYKNQAPTYSAENVTLSSTAHTGTITCTNQTPFEYWLNGFSSVVENIFGKTNTN